MTLTLKPKINKSLGNQIPDNIKNVQSIIALKRYLDLTLTGTKKSLAEHGKKGRKAYPPSPYSFDKPQLERTIQQALKDDSDTRKVGSPPKWVQNINEKICKHTGEAPMFAESLLPSNKTEQLKRNESRPLSGLSTKSAPLMINGEMYYRPNRKYTYLQASSRPCSAKENRETRASVLRNKHRMQAMSASPSNDTRIRLKEIKQMKPKMQQLNKDLLPIPCHTGETPHSFIVGARYNCSSHMDARSYARLGLYVPRKNPQQTFLKVYKGDDASTDLASDTDYVGITSVRYGEDSHTTDTMERRKPPPGRSLPPPHVRKVVRENWLAGNPPETKPLPYKPPSGRKKSAASSKRSASSEAKSKTSGKSTSKSELKTLVDSTKSKKSSGGSHTKASSNFNVQGRPAPRSPSPESDLRNRVSEADIELRSRPPSKDELPEAE